LNAFEIGLYDAVRPTSRWNSSGHLAVRDVARIPAILTGVMLLMGFITCILSGVNPLGLVMPYLSAGIGVTLASILIFMFGEVAKLTRGRPNKPLQIAFKKLRPRLPLLILPSIIFPAFLVGFTATKTAIPFLVGYRWDAVWAASDRLIFGDDAWRITHRLIGTWSMPAWEWLYTFGWGAVLIYTISLLVLYASPRRIAVFYTAMMSTWLVGGCLGAYCFSAAGPVFAPIINPDLARGFNPLRELLAQRLGSDSLVRATQQYLGAAIDSHIAVKGGGISAMPSMHLGAASIYVLAARGTKWLVPALLFWMFIYFASAYFGYHYWVDGIIAAAIAWVCWRCSAAFFNERGVTGSPA
jgi:hypothetical protein